MSKQYGLIVPDKDKPKTFARPSVFGSDSDSEPEVSRPIGLRPNLKPQDKIMQSKALEQDPTVYQYDELYDEMDKKRKESKLSRKDLDKKPKYISRLLAAAEKRKKENERRIERQVQKEREAEGEEFKDKESFVTSAYRKKLEEMKELEELEKREEYLEAIGDVTKQGNLDGFYRHLYDQKVNYNDGDNDKDKKEDGGKSGEKNEEEIVKREIQSDDDSSASGGESRKQAKKRKYRQRADSDHADQSDAEIEKAEVEVKKEHLPSNLDADSDFSIDSSSSDESGDENKEKSSSKTKADSTKLAADNIEIDKKEVKVETPVDGAKADDVAKVEMAPPVVKKPKIDIWKKRTVGEVFDAALQRYFERKSLREL